MRKTLIILLCLCMLTVLAVPVMAAGSLKLSVSKTTVHRGDEFTVTVSVSGVEAEKRGGISVTCDSKFVLKKGEWLIDGATFTEFDVGDKMGTFVYADAKKLSGAVFKLTFEAKSDAKFDSGDITVKFTLGVSGSASELSKSVKVTVACDHKYGAWSKDGDSRHSRKCSTCGNVETKSHSYDNDCDPTCNDCGATRTTTHSFGTDWVSDGTGHWHGCTVCGEKSDFAEHIPGEPAGEYTDQVCTACSYVLATALGHEHRYDETYTADETGHWQTCLGCGEDTEATAHSFDDDCDELCDTCGYERAVQHPESEKWHTSTQAHWKVCDDCDQRLQQGDHIWDSGTVLQEPAWKQPGQIQYHCGICDAEWTDSIPQLTLTQALAWWVWLLIGVAAGGVLTVGIGLAIILPNALRRNRGRFSH